MWSRARCDFIDSSGVKGVRAVVVGHTPFKQMTSLDNVIYIDTMGWKGYDFTILDAATLKPAVPSKEGGASMKSRIIKLNGIWHCALRGIPNKRIGIGFCPKSAYLDWLGVGHG